MVEEEIERKESKNVSRLMGEREKNYEERKKRQKNKRPNKK